MQNLPRILHVIDSLNIGGSEKQCVQLVQHIDRDAYDIHLLTLDKNGPLSADVARAEIPLREFRITSAFYHPRSLLQILRMAAYMRKNRFHIVQTYGFYSNIPGILAAKLANVPIIIGGKRALKQGYSRIKITTEMFLLKKCSSVVVNARMVKRYLIEEGGVPDSIITVIKNSIDMKSYDKLVHDMQTRPVVNTPTVGMIANFRPEKDHITFIEAAAIVCKEKPEVMFALVGSGALENDLRKHADRLNLEGNLIFHGSQTGNTLLNTFKTFTMTVLASHTEGMPNVLIESMALGIPVIANPVGGIPELITDGQTGLLFPHKRPDILARKIITLLDKPQLANRIGQTGSSHVRKYFSQDRITGDYKKLYQRLLTS